MSEEIRNKWIAMRYFKEIMTDGNLGSIYELLAPDFVFTLPTHPEPYRGPDGFKELVTMLHGCFPDFYIHAKDMVAMGDMVVLRDPTGLRPMTYAVNGTMFGAASESVALQNLGFRDIKSLAPGEMILIRDGQFSLHRFAEPRTPSHCFFEWIYFANVASTLDERSVYLSRSRLGQELAKQERALDRVPLDPAETVVVPVPDTGKAAADAMAFALGIPSVEGLIRNRYIGRTFIEGGNRADKVRLKFTPLREVLQGKKVLLVEDSIVRSTTLQSLLRHLREQGGAAEVHVRVACPPILAPCFYGIDMSTVKELFAPKFMAGKVPTVAEQDRMAKELGADSLFYLPVDAVSRCIGLPDDRRHGSERWYIQFFYPLFRSKRAETVFSGMPVAAPED